MRIVLLICYCLFVAPVRVALTLHTTEQTMICGHARVSIYGIGVTIPLRIVRREGPTRFFVQIGSQRLQPLKIKKRKKPALTKAFPPLAKNLRAWRSCFNARLCVRLGLADASATALACGALQQGAALLSPLHVLVSPDYQHAGYALQFCCIAVFRLGKLWITAALLLFGLAARKMAGGARDGRRSKSANQPGNANGA